MTAASPHDLTSPPRDQTMLSFEQVVKRYGPVFALDHVDLTVRRGELLCLLGSSGSGKTTMLNIVGGFIVPDAGRVMLRELDVTTTRPDKRNIGVVFQSYALFPHMTALANVTYGLRARKVAKAEAERRGREVLDLVGLADYADRRPDALSGGQQQRVAVARALAPRPDVLLLDEPLSNLDVTLREDLGLELRRVHDETGITTIMVTHDPHEALSLGDRIAVMDKGRILQIDVPGTVYRSPLSVQAARTVSKANIVRGTVRALGADGVEIDFGTFSLSAPRPAGTVATGDVVDVAVRRESIVVRPADGATAGSGVVIGLLQSLAYRGATVDMVVTDGDRRLLVTAPMTADAVEGALVPGQSVAITFRGEEAVVLANEAGQLTP